MFDRKRALSNDIILTNKYLSMSENAKVLYILLSLNADDDGFVEPHIYMQLNKSNTNNLIELAKNEFITVFQRYKRENDYITVIAQTDEHIENINLDKVYVIYISDWYIVNNIRKDIYKETAFIEETKYIYLDNIGKTTAKNKENKYMSLYEMKMLANGEPLSKKKIKNIYKERAKEKRIDTSNNCITNLEYKDNIDKSYGEFNNIYLTDDEYYSLKEKYKNADKLIDKISSIIENRNTKSKISSYRAYIEKIAIEDKWEITDSLKEKEIIAKKEKADILRDKEEELERNIEDEKLISSYMNSKGISRKEAIEEIDKEKEILQLSMYLRTNLLFGKEKTDYEHLIEKYKNEPRIKPLLRSKGLL